MGVGTNNVLDRLECVFLLLAFMTLARLQSIEALRYRAPGEWGKLLGLDRIPEVKTKLCEELNATQTIFPDTDLRMIFKLRSD